MGVLLNNNGLLTVIEIVDALVDQEGCNWHNHAELFQPTQGNETFSYQSTI